MRRLLRIRHTFLYTRYSALRTAGLDARRRPLHPAQPSSSATAAASVRWFQPSRPPPIPPFHSMALRVLFAGKLKPQDPWQIWEFAGWRSPTARSRRRGRLRSSFLSAGRPRRVCAQNRRPLRDRDSPISTVESRSRSLIGPAISCPPMFFATAASCSKLHTRSEPALPELYTVYSDGSGVESYRCDHGAARHSGSKSARATLFLSPQSRSRAIHVGHGPGGPISAPAGEYAGEVARDLLRRLAPAWRAEVERALSTDAVDAGLADSAPRRSRTKSRRCPARPRSPRVHSRTAIPRACMTGQMPTCFA